MRVSYNWLRELLPGLTATPAEIAQQLTLHSFEAHAGLEQAIDPAVIVVKIIRLEAHPNADRLRLATIDTGQQEITVVCGAPNIAAGDIVPYAPPGTRVANAVGITTILRAAKIRGVQSPGMLASLRELGLGKDQAGIWLLPADTPIGTALATLIPADTILNLDLTPNRAHDCLSHVGVARELAALYDLVVSEPTLPPLPTILAGDITVDIENTAHCPRYLAARINHLHAAPSPLWLQARLLAAGGKPINNLVDITNYVMFEYGNPCHLFDRSRLPGATITVRQARAGEQLPLLDGTPVALAESDLVIAAGEEPVALAGIMGGLASAVSPATTEAVLEVASFKAFSIQETARRLTLRTEASLRFNKGLEPARVEVVARRVLSLLAQAGGQVVGVTDSYPSRQAAKTIVFNPARPTELAGHAISPEYVKAALTKLRFDIAEKSTEVWHLIPPADRLDISGPHDVTEEVIRLFGLENISASNLAPEAPATWPAGVYWREVVRDTLVGLGFTETYNASFEPAALAAVLQLDQAPHLAVVNPPAPDRGNLRRSLLPGLLQNAVANRAWLHRESRRGERALFEIGHVWIPGEGGWVPGVVESQHLAGVVVGSGITLENIAAALAASLGLDQLQLTNELSPEVVRAIKYRVPLSAFEINLTEVLQRVAATPPPAPTLKELEQAASGIKQYEPIPRYPAVYRDLSILVDPAVKLEQVQDIIERAGGPLVDDVDLFDDYDFSPQRKSFAFHVAYQAPDRTLTDAEVAEVHNHIIATLHQELGAQLRE